MPKAKYTYKTSKCVRTSKSTPKQIERPTEATREQGRGKNKRTQQINKYFAMSMKIDEQLSYSMEIRILNTAATFEAIARAASASTGQNTSITISTM